MITQINSINSNSINAIKDYRAYLISLPVHFHQDEYWNNVLTQDPDGFVERMLTALQVQQIMEFKVGDDEDVYELYAIDFLRTDSNLTISAVVERLTSTAHYFQTKLK